MNEKDEWHVLDLVQADRLLLMFKRGIIGVPDSLTRSKKEAQSCAARTL
jgi:hypothetical protein